MVEVPLRPDARGAHGLDEVGAGEQGYADMLTVAVDVLAAAQDAVYLMVEVVEDLGGGDVLGLDSLPGVARQPFGGLLGGERAHLYAVFGRGQTQLLVARGHWGEEAADDLVLGVELGVVGGHLEHAQVEEGDGTIGRKYMVRTSMRPGLAWRAERT